MILSISWKNIWRNKTRSLVVITAVTVGLFGAVFGVALMQGIMEQRSHDAINNEISHIQIHHKKFRNNFKTEYYIPKSEVLLEKIRAVPNVKGACSRMKTMAMGFNSYATVGMMINAIEPEQEKQVTTIYQNIIDSAGTYFEADWDNAILISSTLAKDLKIVQFKITDKTIEKLHTTKMTDETILKINSLKGELFRKEKQFTKKLEELVGKENFEEYETVILNNSIRYKIRSKIILKFQGADGKMIDEAFKVVGIFKTTNSMYDKMNVFVKKTHFVEITGFDKSNSHEIAIMLDSEKELEETTAKISALCPNLETINYFKIDPMLEMMTKWAFLYNYIIIIIILFALGFGIVNTMLMVVLERVKELGMLMAIGMNKKKIFLMIMLESVFLSIIGGILGMLLGGLTSWQIGIHGWDISQYAEGFEAMGYSAIIYPSLTWDFLFGTTILVVLTGIISSIYPARKALKLNPADAIRTDA